MAERSDDPSPGGFIPDSLPSPSPSAASTRSVAGLPHPRSKALRAGSSKEDVVRRYVESQLMHINRRYVKKFGLPEPDDAVVGYKSMGELCKDAEGLVNVLWLSGTPSLQVPYLLNLANELNTWMASFPPSPMATFSLLRKLDHCFASLLTGQDLVTKETLPGFENGLRGGMSTTDMVRCKSTVAQTRVLVVSVMSKEPAEEEEYANGGSQDEQEEDEAGMNSDGGMAAGAWDEDDERLHMDVARVYENTLVQLGDVLGEDFLGDL